MVKLRSYLWLILGLSAIPLPGMAAGLWLYEFATPNMGTASAGRAAVASDASTAGANPAGMVLLDQSQLIGGLQMLYVDARFDTEFAEFGGDDGGNAGGWVPAGSFSYAHKVSDDLSLGIAVGTYFGLGLDYGTSWAGRYYVQEAEFVTFGFNPGIGYRVDDHWSVGAGVSVVNSLLMQKVGINNLDPNQADGQIKLEDDDWGYGYNLGLIYEQNEQTRFGLSYRSEVDFDYEDTVSTKGVQPPLSTLSNFLGITDNKVDMEMNLPQTVTFSAYHKINKRLALLGNIGWQEWSSFGETTIFLQSQNTTELTQDRNFDDTWHYAAGMQYQIDEGNLLSLGIAYDESPVSETNRTLDMPLDRQWRYAIGLEQDLSDDMTIGYAYELLDAGKAEVDQNRGPLAGEIKGDYSSNYIHIFNVSLAKRF